MDSKHMFNQCSKIMCNLTMTRHLISNKKMDRKRLPNLFVKEKNSSIPHQLRASLTSGRRSLRRHWLAGEKPVDLGLAGDMDLLNERNRETLFFTGRVPQTCFWRSPKNRNKLKHSDSVVCPPAVTHSCTETVRHGWFLLLYNGEDLSNSHFHWHLHKLLMPKSHCVF